MVNHHWPNDQVGLVDGWWLMSDGYPGSPLNIGSRHSHASYMTPCVIAATLSATLRTPVATRTWTIFQVDGQGNASKWCRLRGWMVEAAAPVVINCWSFAAWWWTDSTMDLGNLLSIKIIRFLLIIDSNDSFTGFHYTTQSSTTAADWLILCRTCSPPQPIPTSDIVLVIIPYINRLLTKSMRYKCSWPRLC